MEIKTYIQDLFKYLDAFEKNDVSFDTEAFLQTYNGIYAVFQALRQQRDKAIEVDQFILDRIKRQPISSSDLRQIAIQIMITYFESEADADGQSNRSWLYCRELRAIKQDATLFENNLVPLILKEGSFNNNHRFGLFFLNEVARYINKFGRKIHTGLSPEEFSGMPDHMKFLELARRRMELGAELLRDRSSLEFHLQRVGIFNKLGQKSKGFEYLLTEWKYISKTGFWIRFKAGLGRFFGKIKGAFSSFRYFRLVMTQRNAAYLYYLLIIAIFILLAVYVPIKWRQYSQNQLGLFQERANKVQNMSTR